MGINQLADMNSCVKPWKKPGFIATQQVGILLVSVDSATVINFALCG